MTSIIIAIPPCQIQVCLTGCLIKIIDQWHRIIKPYYPLFPRPVHCGKSSNDRSGSCCFWLV
ncbi:hypothetical protein, partial [Methanobrevibacter sp.]|uniref:hypothetical protein n=1 Tax=Methanobrevibacter sp. TaxID=66852 RepID=UPI002E7A00F9